MGDLEKLSGTLEEVFYIGTDGTVSIGRDVGDNLTLTDSVTGTKKLSELGVPPDVYAANLTFISGAGWHNLIPGAVGYIPPKSSTQFPFLKITAFCTDDDTQPSGGWTIHGTFHVDAAGVVVQDGTLGGTPGGSQSLDDPEVPGVTIQLVTDGTYILPQVENTTGHTYKFICTSVSNGGQEGPPGTGASTLAGVSDMTPYMRGLNTSADAAAARGVLAVPASVDLYSTCLESALPTPTTALTSAIRDCTDTRIRYRCDGTLWVPDSEYQAPMGIGPFSSAPAILVATSNSLHPEIFTAGATNGTIIALLYIRTNPHGGAWNFVWNHGENGVYRGFFFVYDSAGPNFRVYGTGDIPLTDGVNHQDLSTQVGNIVAIAVTKRADDSVDYCWLGTVRTATATAVGMQAPLAATFNDLGGRVADSSAYSDMDIVAVAAWEEALTPSEMIAASAQTTGGFIPAVLGKTKVVDYMTSRDRPVGSRIFSRGKYPITWGITGALVLTPR